MNMIVSAQPRLTYLSVTNFLYVGDEYLFLHRAPHKKVDANRLNGIGGKVDPGENYLMAAIRETYEETGYKVTAANIQLSGVARLEGGYQEDWVFCFFKISVPDKNIPKGFSTDDGEFMWLHKDEALKSQYEMVDDLKICFPKVVESAGVFFFSAQMNDQEKIASYTLTDLPFSAAHSMIK
jgi:8-oxo-dGTP pyrophosphatase MutT (NUDIX family)